MSELQFPKIEESPLVSKSAEIVISDQATYDEACSFLKELVKVRKSIEEQTSPTIKKAHEIHKELKEAQNKLLEPVDRAESVLRGKISSFAQEQERKRIEELKRREVERRKAEEEARLKVAAQLEAQKRTEQADAVLEGKLTTDEVVNEIANTYIEPEVAPVIKSQGVSMSTKYEILIENKLSFIRWIASNPDKINFLDVNITAVRKFAEATSGNVQIPGIVISKGSVTRVRV